MAYRTPTTNDVRAMVVDYHVGDKEEIGRAFDRWLAEHDEALRFELMRVQAELQKSKDATASVLRELEAERGRIASSAYHQRMVQNAHDRGVTETVQRIRDYIGGQQ